MHLEGNILISVAVDVLKLNDDIIAHARLSWRVLLGHFAANHQLDEFVYLMRNCRGILVGDEGIDIFAVPDDFYPIGQPEDFLEPVRNVDD